MMGKDEIISVSLIPASELFSHIGRSSFDTLHEAKGVLVQKENFKQFSAFLENITVILKEFSTLNVIHSESLKNALGILNREVRVAKQLAFECSNRNKIYLLINCRKIVKCLESSTKEIGRALSLIPLASLDVPSSLNQKINKLCEDMLNAEYQTDAVEEEIMEKIDIGIKGRNVDRSYANNLLILIADAVGISTEQLAMKREFEGFKSEIEDAKLRKEMSEVLRMEQIIALVEKADATTSHEEKEIRYIEKRNSLGRQLLEPLQSFYCPITQDVMVDPVETSSGKTFERSAIEKWFAEGNTLCPLTMIHLDTSILRSNKPLQQSIEEWKDRNTMITIASMKSKLQQLNEEQEVLDSLIQLRDLCMERELHREWVTMEDYIPVFIGLLGTKNRDIRIHTLVILCILVKDSDNNKERIFCVNNAIETIVHSLARQIGESKLSLQLLLELSRSNVIRDSIGNAQGCILLLVNMSSGDNTEAAKDAQELLNNLAVLDQNVIKMAKANYFRPLLHCLSSGADNVKIIMAETLSEIELTDNNKLSLLKEGALGPLLQLLSHGDIEKKIAAVKALQNLSTVPQIGLQMIREGAPIPLFELLYRHNLSLPSLREQVAATIMNLAISSIFQDADQVQVSLLESEEDIFKLFSLISLTGPNVQQSILRTFHAMCQSPSGSDIRTKLRQISAVQVLVQLCECDNYTIRENAIKLFRCLTEDGHDRTFLEHVGQRCIETLLRIIKSSDNVEEVAAALGIICNLPKEPQMTQWLLHAGALEIIFACLTDGNSYASHKQLITENAVGALCRFSVSTNQEWQRKVVEAGIFPALVKSLVSGTALMKQNAAISLKQFSESSISLSQPVKKQNGAFWCCLASPETGCPAHLGICTVESSFCLLEGNAIEPLVKLLGDPDHGACEASLDALLTLTDGGILQNGSTVLAKANAIPPIIRLLSSPSVRLQEKALKALERIFQLAEYKQRYGSSAQMALVDIAQRGSKGMKSLAGKILSYLNVLHEQSSYF